ncbi:MAG TPA: TAT-variant-translocated molybdopterin oxidoreductase [Pyrinomonadaceae bacterium]|nr:TAT-variant-translocated molybdopterin oxidoreductase [Pyrinomonadaceae bacterium]
MSEDRHINFKLMRERILAEQNGQDVSNRGKKFWRSLEELSDSPEFREFVEREYPQHAEEWNDPFERRTFLKLMGASMALAGLSGCVFQPAEKIVPNVKQAEDSVPGKALFFATASTLGGIATPLLARSNEGRPTKLEGNPDHPNNRNGATDDRGSSATDIFSQASVLSLYDPDRSKTPLFRDESRTWATFVGELRTALDEQRPKQGAGIRFLTETITSPTMASQLKSILTDFPQAKWHQYEPVNNDNARAGAVMAFGQPVNTIYDFSKADRILALDADFLSAHPGTLKYARDFAARRRLPEHPDTYYKKLGIELVPDIDRLMNRLYVIETSPTTTGAAADHHWAVKPSELLVITKVLAAIVAPPTANTSGATTPLLGAEGPFGTNPSNFEASPKWIEAVAKDLREHQGVSLVIAGREAPPEVHALAHKMNAGLGNVGKTVFYTDPVEANSVDQKESLRELLNDINDGHVEMLVIIGGNPVYNTPADLKLDYDRMFKVSKLRIHLSAYRDETSELCHWNIPESHYLEMWSDVRSYDGTVTIVQPLIEPLYQTKSAHELLAAFTPQYDRKPYEIIRDYWQKQPVSSQQSLVASQPSANGNQQTATGTNANRNGASQPTGTGGVPPATERAARSDFESWWRKCVHDGFIPGTALPAKTVSPNSAASNQPTANAPSASPGFELAFRTDPTIYDGRFANNGWLQELPKPLSKVTWDNAALISPKTAQQLGITKTIGKKGGDTYVDTLKITHQGRTITAAVPAWITPGQPDGVITLHLGYGRKRGVTVADNPGFSAYDIRTADSPWSLNGAQVEKSNEQHQLAVTQLHFLLEDRDFSKEDRDVLRSQTLEEYLKGTPAGESHDPPPDDTLYDPKLYDYQNQGNGLNYAWGMAIDLNNCVGCNACTIACQSENNIPVVGKEQVTRSREMHWIRVDTYFKGEDANNPEATNFMPVPCMHCENAPCEPVCPVHATVHSAEGLNDMVYNRCVGTKYCSNNCPYKVRRFNFFLYQDWDQPTYQLMRNPDVSIRSRGVMEKCTYCVQRIQGAKIQSEIEGRKIHDGEIVTACQAVCPTEAIVFGDVNDPNSRVSRIKKDSRNYSLLGELNTKPRTTYLTALRNPNPEIKEA